jgi:sugar phosphate isomerase/epimerase
MKCPSKYPKLGVMKPRVRQPGKNEIFLGTVALDPNRWGAISKDRKPTLEARDWLARAEQVGFDGVELWEHHAMLASEVEVSALQTSALPIVIWNSYVSFDESSDRARVEIADWVERLGCGAVKFNVGSNADGGAAYARRLIRFIDRLPTGTRLICECHAGTAAHDPKWARQLLEDVGDADRVQALVHLGDEPGYIDSMFAELGDRISHVHVNFLQIGAPPLSEIAGELRSRLDRIHEHGFAGSYSLEFVNGVGGDLDRPAKLLEAAESDLAVLRAALA